MECGECSEGLSDRINFRMSNSAVTKYPSFIEHLVPGTMLYTLH